MEKRRRKDVGGKRKGAEDSRESGQLPVGCRCCRLSPLHPSAGAHSWLLTTCTAFFFFNRFCNAKYSLSHYLPDALGRAHTHTRTPLIRCFLRAGDGGL